MTWNPERMMTAEGPRYRFWNTVSDCYQNEPMTLEEASALWADRLGRPADLAAEALERIAVDVDQWTSVVFCGGCGGNMGAPGECCGEWWGPR